MFGPAAGSYCDCIVSSPFIRIPWTRIRNVAVPAAALLLAACNSAVLNPSGDIALQQRDLLIQATVLMLIIIVPVMVLIVIFAWRYRQSNKSATYAPDWHHSTQLELVIWSAPLLIIICLGALTWLGTHLLDPYRPLDRLAPGQPVAPGTKPLVVNVVALDWKWLFIYPEYGVATINELALPTDRPVSLRITASTVMNSLYIPALAGQVYAMPGMETQLHAVMNRTGVSQGFSANYSGAGFSGMRLTLRGLTHEGFEEWLGTARAGGGELTRAGYLQVAQPSENEPIRHFASVDPGLYRAILNRCVEPGTTCMDHTMAMDAARNAGARNARDAASREAGANEAPAAARAPREAHHHPAPQ